MCVFVCASNQNGLSGDSPPGVATIIGAYIKIVGVLLIVSASWSGKQRLALVQFYIDKTMYLSAL